MQSQEIKRCGSRRIKGAVKGEEKRGRLQEKRKGNYIRKKRKVTGEEVAVTGEVRVLLQQKKRVATKEEKGRLQEKKSGIYRRRERLLHKKKRGRYRRRTS